jgi:hypothetical protein
MGGHTMESGRMASNMEKESLRKKMARLSGGSGKKTN